MASFCWASPGPLPHEYDLQRSGWQRNAGPPGRRDDSLLLIARHRPDRTTPTHSVSRSHSGHAARTLCVGICEPDLRARLLDEGFGDVLGPDLSYAEFAIRARRVLERLEHLPRHRAIGALRLDLLARDGSVEGRPLALHPREFAMLWYLAGLNEGGASRAELLGEVWDVHHEPETNSVAVHAFRIRAKLRLAGLEGMLRTDAAGRYRLIALDASAPMGDAHREECRRDPAIL